MDILYYLTFGIFILWVVRKIFYWVSVWQDCDYNPANFFDYLRSERRERSKLFTIVVYLRLLILLAYVAVIFTDNLLLIYQTFVILFFFFQFFLLLQEIFKREVKIPSVTFRSILLTLLSFGVIAFISLFPLMEHFFWLLLLDLLSPAIITLFVYFTLFPTEIISDLQVELAAEKLEDFPELLVIVVAGDEETSATRDYIAEFLKKKYDVEKNNKSKNQAVIETILTKIKKNTEVLVVDIQTKNKEEVKILSSLLHPKIVVLTAFNNRLRKKKFREMAHIYTKLTDAISQDGFTLFNGGSKNLRSMYNRKHKQKALYIFDALDKEKIKDKNTIIGYQDEKHKRKLSFAIRLRGKNMHISLPPISSLECVLPAVYIANILGISEADIQSTLKRQV